MAKRSGSTRVSSSSSPNGVTSSTSRNVASTTPATQIYDIAERLYANRDLTVDPGDAVYEQARNLYDSSIESSIENTTNYSALVRGNEIDLWENNLEIGEAESRWGLDDKVTIPMENRSLMDIINELRVENVSTIYKKYGSRV